MASAAPAGFSGDGSGDLFVVSNSSGVRQLYVLRCCGSGVPQPLVHIPTGPDPVNVALPVPGDSRVLFATDHGGDERLQIFIVDADAAAPASVVVDAAFIHRLGGVSRDGRLISYACNRRNGRAFDIYVRGVPTLSGGEDCAPDRMVYESDGWAEAGGFSPDGAWVAVVVRGETRALDGDLWLVAADGGGRRVHVTPHEEASQFGLPAGWWGAGEGEDARGGFYFSGNAGRDTLAVARCRAPAAVAAAGSAWPHEYVAAGASEWDVRVLCASGDGARILVEINEDGYSRLELRRSGDYGLVAEVQLPGGSGGGGRGRVAVGDAACSFGPVMSADGALTAFAFVSPSEPGDVWLYDAREGGRLARVTALPRAVPAASMVAPSLHRFASFDGLLIPAFVYMPHGAVADVVAAESCAAATAADAIDAAAAPADPSHVPPPPVVVLIHGGPESQYIPAFNPAVQFLCSRGYAVVAPNIRGSTGYGKAFAALDDVRLRPNCMRDLTALRAWVPRIGLDGNRAALFGQSYGGYMVLAGLAFQPQSWAAGVCFYGIGDMVAFLERTAPWRRAIREVEYGTLAHDREFLTSISPLHAVADIAAPLLLVHGANDPRVPLGESQAIAAALAARGVPVDLIVYGNEGHGLAHLENRIDVYPRVVAFLERALRG